MKNKTIGPTIGLPSNSPDAAHEPVRSKASGQQLPRDKNGTEGRRSPGLAVVPDASNPEQTAPAGPTKDEQALPLADATPRIVWSALPDGRADYFNQRWFEYTGLTLEQSQDMGWQS